jgi:hypothetical protein
MNDIGEELPDDEAAWREATTLAGEIFKDVDGNLKPGEEWVVDVTDQDRQPLFLIRISTRKLK